jgi:hypothetical protein
MAGGFQVAHQYLQPASSRGSAKFFCALASRFRLCRHPPTIVTWAELDFYDLPLIRPSGS